MAAVAPLTEVLERLEDALGRVVGAANRELIATMRLHTARHRGEPIDRLTERMLEARDELIESLRDIRRLVIDLHRLVRNRQRSGRG